MLSAREKEPLPGGGVPRGEDPAHGGRGPGAEQDLDVEVIPDTGGHVGDVLLGVDVRRPDHGQADWVTEEVHAVQVGETLQLAGVVEAETLDEEVGPGGDDEVLAGVEVEYPLQGGVVAVRVTGEVETGPGLETEGRQEGKYPGSTALCKQSSQPLFIV